MYNENEMTTHQKTQKPWEKLNHTETVAWNWLYDGAFRKAAVLADYSSLHYPMW